MKCVISGVSQDANTQLINKKKKKKKKISEINSFMTDVYRQVLSQMAPDQRQAMLTNLDILKASMEAVKEMMV